MKTKVFRIVGVSCLLLAIATQDVAAQSSRASDRAALSTTKAKKNAPIDGGISLLLGAGAALGLAKARKNRKEKAAA